MEITKVQVSLHKNPDSKVRAFCSIDVAFPLNEKYRVYIENCVLDEYEAVLNKIANGSPHADTHQEN